MSRLLINPAAGNGRGANLLEQLGRRNDLEIRIPETADALEQEARRAVGDGVERLLVAGGDGTWNRAAGALAGSRCAMGLVPVGSGNDLARSLEIPLDPVTAVDRALGSRPRPIDLGDVDGHPFLSFAAVGFNTEVARFANDRMRRRGSPWIYAYATLRTLLSYRAPSVRIEADGSALSGPVMLAVFANAPYFGGGMRIVPDATVDDGHLDLLVVERLPVHRFVAVFPRVYRGTHVKHRAVRHLRFRDASLRAEPEIDLYADGEALGRAGDSPRRIRVRTAGLLVLA